MAPPAPPPGPDRPAVTLLHGGLELLQHDFMRSCADLRGTALRLAEGGAMKLCLDADMAGAVLLDPVATATFADDLVAVGRGAGSTPKARTPVPSRRVPAAARGPTASRPCACWRRGGRPMPAPALPRARPGATPWTCSPAPVRRPSRIPRRGSAADAPHTGRILAHRHRASPL